VAALQYFQEIINLCSFTESDGEASRGVGSRKDNFPSLCPWSWVIRHWYLPIDWERTRKPWGWAYPKNKSKSRK